MGNKYNEQKELAWEVIHHLLKPGARRTFEDNLRVFSDWSKNWSKQNKKLLKERKELEARMSANVFRYEKRLAVLCKEMKKLPESEDSRRDFLVRKIENEPNRYLKKRASLKDKHDQLKTPAPSPWELVRDIPERSRDEHNTNLTKFMFGDTPAPKTSSEQQFCRWYVRLSILRDKALPEEEPPIIAEGVLDPEEVEITWVSIQNDWDSWHPVIKNALKFVTQNLKTVDIGQGQEPKESKKSVDAGTPTAETPTNTEQEVLGEVANEVENEDVIYIDLSKFSKGYSLTLLKDLLADFNRDGVILDEKIHGKSQPRALRGVLKDHSYDDVVRVKRIKNKVKLLVPFNKITTEQKK